jgi:hypothetical protein
MWEQRATTAAVRHLGASWDDFADPQSGISGYYVQFFGQTIRAREGGDADSALLTTLRRNGSSGGGSRGGAGGGSRAMSNLTALGLAAAAAARADSLTAAEVAAGSGPLRNLTDLISVGLENRWGWGGVDAGPRRGR